MTDSTTPVQAELTVNNSVLTKLLSTAFDQWATEPNKNAVNILRNKAGSGESESQDRQSPYASLYDKHLGSLREAPEHNYETAWPEIVDGTDLYERLFVQKKVRIGYVPKVLNDNQHKPYGYYSDGNRLGFSSLEGDVVGFEFELGNILFDVVAEHYGIEGLTVEWVEVTAELLGDPDDNGRMYDALHNSLEAKETDVAISGIIDNLMKGDEVTVTIPTLTFFTGVFYTGLDYDLYYNDLNAIANGPGTELEKYGSLVAFLTTNSEIKLAATAPEGKPSYNSGGYLWARAVDGQEDPSLAPVESIEIEDIPNVLDNKTHHFFVADGIILANYAVTADTEALNMNFNVRFKGMDPENIISLNDLLPDTNVMVPFTLID